MTRKTESLSGPVLEEDLQLSLGELSQACRVEVEFIVELVQEGVLEPEDTQWRFPGSSLPRLRKAVNLHRDLGLNLAGIALVLDLLEEREQLHAQLTGHW